jgi:hypothetical protein
MLALAANLRFCVEIVGVFRIFSITGNVNRTDEEQAEWLWLPYVLTE